MIAFRVTEKRYKHRAFNGKGAEEHGGRYNNKGTAIVYTADSVALGILEILANYEEVDLEKYFVYTVQIPDALIEEFPKRKLPTGWNGDPAPASTKQIGDDFVKVARTAALKIPNASSPEEFTVLINPAHPNIGKIKISRPRALKSSEKVKKMHPKKSTLQSFVICDNLR